MCGDKIHYNIRSFGRINGRGVFKKYQNYINEIIPKESIKVDCKFDINNIFSNDNNKFCVEIGSGYGETVTSLALKNKDTNYIACEVYTKGLINILKIKEQYQLNNLKIFNGDARVLLNNIRDNSIDQLLLLFPDPWPKKKHNKRRIVNEQFIQLINQKIKYNGNFVFASDIDSYISQVQELINTTNVFEYIITDNTTEPHWWVKTKYQNKAIQEGRTCKFFEFRHM